MYVFGRFRLVRSFMVWIYSRRRTEPVPALTGSTLVEDVNIGEAASSICRDGFFSGLRLRAEAVEQLLTFSSLAACFGEGKLDLPFRYADKDSAEQEYGQTFKLGRYRHALLSSPALRALV
jgi:hypothetical protein